MAAISLVPNPDPCSQDYWFQSRQPLASLAFIAPILLVYEAGVIALGPQAVRNGADVWLRRFPGGSWISGSISCSLC